MDNPFFTVVIPTHNRSALLKRAIQSVLDQTFKDFEIIVVDDHSIDDTYVVVRSFSDPRIRYMTNRRTKGACGARNVGIFSARGAWVAFLDDDDVWLPEKLASQYQVAKSIDETFGLICTDYAIYKDKQTSPGIYKNRLSGWVRDKLLFGHSMGCLSSTCIRSDILREIEGFDERFPSNQDQDLWLRVAELSKFTYVPRTMVNMYQENRNRIGQDFKSKLAGYILIRNKYSDLINQSLRLRHHCESRIFTYALLEKNRPLLAKCIPWFLLGAFIDLPNFLRTVYTVLILAYRKKAQKY